MEPQLSGHRSDSQDLRALYQSSTEHYVPPLQPSGLLRKMIQNFSLPSLSAPLESQRLLVIVSAAPGHLVNLIELTEMCSEHLVPLLGPSGLLRKTG